MSTSGQYFAPNWRMNSAPSIDQDTRETLRRWYKASVTEPAPVRRVFDLGYGADEALVTVSLDDAAILLAAPVDNDLLDRLVSVRKQQHAEQRWMVALGKNCIGAETELIQVDLSFDDAKASADELDLVWRAANPKSGFGTRRHATIKPHPVEVYVRVRASTVEHYAGTSKVAAKYQAAQAELKTNPEATTHDVAVDKALQQTVTSCDAPAAGSIRKHHATRPANATRLRSAGALSGLNQPQTPAFCC
jgi:hypothetical protein